MGEGNLEELLADEHEEGYRRGRREERHRIRQRLVYEIEELSIVRDGDQKEAVELDDLRNLIDDVCPEK